MRAIYAVAAIAVAMAPPATAQPLLASEFPARILKAHNVERAALGLPPLVWDNNLGNAAAAYAQQMAFTGIFRHSDRRTRPKTGENLWYGTHGAFTIEAMVRSWASEKRFFRPGVFPNVSRTGNWMDVAHYTYMVWPTTLRIGCALASTARMDYLVCRYAPKGNIDGKPVP